MADYRADLLLNIEKNIRKSYIKLYKNYPNYGIFGKETRQKLLEYPEHDHTKYGPQSWSKIRKSIRRGLLDISLFCNIANSEQLEKTLFDSAELPIPNTMESSSRHLFPYLISVIFNQKPKEKSDAWKLDMANRILFEVFTFYRNTEIVNSKSYLRLLEEVEDFLKIELERTYRENKKD